MTNTTNIVAPATFHSLFASLVEQAKTITDDPKSINNGCHEEIYNAIIEFISKLSISQERSLRIKADEYIQEDSCELPFDADYFDCGTLAIYIMLFTNEELAYQSPQCKLENPLHINDLNLAFWDELSGNSMEWFAKEFWKYAVDKEVKHMFLLRVKHVETTDMEGHALYTTDNKSTIDEATERFAQGFLGSDANPDENCYEFESTKQYALEPLEINSDEYQAFTRLSIQQYKSLAEIPANDAEVAKML